MREKRIVLKPTVTKEAVSLFAEQNHLKFISESPGTETSSEETIWSSEDDKTTLNYLFNSVVNLPYITVRGEQAKAMLELVAKNIPNYSDAELLHDFDTITDVWERVDAVQRLGMGAPVHVTEDVLTRMKQALADPLPEIRLAALIASYYVGWAELLPCIAALRDDPEDDVRESVEGIYEDLEKLIASRQSTEE